MSCSSPMRSSAARAAHREQARSYICFGPIIPGGVARDPLAHGVILRFSNKAVARGCHRHNWPETNGTRWCRLHWPETNGTRWCRLHWPETNGTRWCRLHWPETNGTRWCRLHWPETNGTRWCRLHWPETNGARWCRLHWDRVPGSGVTEPAEGALRAKEDGHRGSWLTLSLRRPNTHQRNHDDQAHYRIDRVG
ncbi:hypothetical protein PshuTeo2_10710 [Pseudomonas hunanensis]|nr:hypothetical protein [Pseudomonas hunanensis]